MPELTVSSLDPNIARKISPFLDAVIEEHQSNIHSAYVVGSALTEDFDERSSDINSVLMLKEMNLSFLASVVPLGKKHRRSRVAAPLIMTPAYLKSSVDVFPLEFLNFKLLHQTVFGDDLFSSLVIDPTDLRRQCERELKADLIGLRGVYLSTLGEPKELTTRLVKSMASMVSLGKGMIVLLGQEPEVGQLAVVEQLGRLSKLDCSVFKSLIELRGKSMRLSRDRTKDLFERYYHTCEKLGTLADEITA
jgi:hypothetical protein